MLTDLVLTISTLPIAAVMMAVLTWMQKKFQRCRTVLTALAVGAYLSIIASFQGILGHPFFSRSGTLQLFIFEKDSLETSQQIADYYTFSHVIHGFLFYWLLHWLKPKWSLSTKMFLALAIESFWEVIENTAFVINRYRSVTVSQDYYGDSILNSMFDIVFCILGFYLASKVKWQYVLIALIAMELFTLFTIRDNLTLNVVMLLFPLERIRTWQAAG